METKFYNFRQNNSGGYFVEDKEHGVCEEIIIEAKNAKKAWKKLKEIGNNVSGFWNYCPCCGERWSSWIDDEDGTDFPAIYGEPIEQVKKGMVRDTVAVHYADGSFKLFDLQD